RNDVPPHANLLTDKQVDPASGTPVVAGQLLTYSLILDNSRGLAGAEIALNDDLSQLLDDADFVAGSLRSSDPGVTAILSPDGRTIIVTGSVAGGGRTQVSYQVRVKADGARGDSSLDNCFGPTCTKNPVELTPPRLTPPTITPPNTRTPAKPSAPTGGTALSGQSVLAGPALAILMGIGAIGLGLAIRPRRS
ncbi:MAG: hypothetical protein LBV30_09495, partial [Propionibacteriaceae bacterium]|nr:hypothetical protein [Propionibacteriaceae bacterium]